MPNRYQLNQLYNKYMGLVYADLLGQSYSIYRPNYNQLDNEPVLVAQNVILRTDPTKSFIETAFGSPKHFSIFANRNLLQPGDLIVYGIYNRPVADRPYLTYAHEAPIKEAIAVRTAQKCHIVDGKINQETGEFNYIAKNVWYDTLDSGHPLENINEGVRNSAKIPNQAVVMYTRSNLQLTPKVTIVDINPTTGQETGIYWTVKQIDKSGQLTVMNVEQSFSAY